MVFVKLVVVMVVNGSVGFLCFGCCEMLISGSSVVVFVVVWWFLLSCDGDKWQW